MKTTLKCLAAATSLALCNVAGAAVVGTLSYIDPTGTVHTTDTIEVWVRLTLAADSDTFNYDPSGDPASLGLGSYLPTMGYSATAGEYVPFASYIGGSQFATRSCSGTFSPGCADVPYRVDQGISSWFAVEKPFSMTAGESRDFLVARLEPVGGAAAPGTYSIYNTGIGISVYGLDADGNSIDADAFRFTTCGDGVEDASCVFTRDVVSTVPVPAAAWLFGSGLLGLAGASTRRPRRG